MKIDDGKTEGTINQILVVVYMYSMRSMLYTLRKPTTVLNVHQIITYS